jgi:hypothetical protein
MNCFLRFFQLQEFKNNVRKNSRFLYRVQVERSDNWLIKKDVSASKKQSVLLLLPPQLLHLPILQSCIMDRGIGISGSKGGANLKGQDILV